MTVYTPPFKSDIFYSVQNEDYQTELAVLNQIRRDALRVILVASSGENALSLLSLDTVGHLDAVDMNPAQLRLCDLRRAAAQSLTRDEQLQLLGADSDAPSAGNDQVRRTLYDRLRPDLTAETRQFWDARRDQEIAFGIQHVGRNEVAMQAIRVQLQAAGFAPLEHPVTAADLPRWKQVYTNLMTTEYIQQLFGVPSQELAGRIARMAGHLGECHFHALRQPLADHNPFVTTVFKGAYADAAGEQGLPVYLQSHGQTALRRSGTSEQMQLHAGNILDWIPRLAATDGRFDLISISNIADWMSETEFSAVVVTARDGLNDGGVLLARTATPNRMIETVMQQYLRVDPQYNIELQQIERGPWFRVISAGFKDK